MGLFVYEKVYNKNMSEFSKNVETDPMSKRQRRRYAAAHTIVSFLTERHPIRERVPGAVGSVLMPHEYQPELPFTAPPLTQPVLERTEAAQLAQTMHGYDANGEYR